MIATGTDVKPLECLVFMRSVKSRTYFEQMLGRGVRVIDDTEFQSVTDDAKRKDRFVVVDAIGVMDSPLSENVQPLERNAGLSLKDVLNQVAFGNRDPDVALVPGRAPRPARQAADQGRPGDAHRTRPGGTDIGTITRNLVDARRPGPARRPARRGPGPARHQSRAPQRDPRRTQVLRQTIDETSRDAVLFAGDNAEALGQGEGPHRLVPDYIEQQKDDIGALQVLDSRPTPAADVQRDQRGRRSNGYLNQWRPDLLGAPGPRRIQSPRLRPANAHQIVALVRVTRCTRTTTI